jgi:GNAT superfamily N-acetyltransferase
MAELEFRELRRDDFDLIRGLYEATKNRLRPEDYDRWRFFDTPWGDSPAVIAVDGTVCAGLYIVWPTMLNLGGEAVLGAQSMDTMTHPAYRGQGLFVGLAEQALGLATARGFDVIYGFPNESSYPGFIRRLNFDHVGDVPSWSHSLKRRPSLGLRTRPPVLDTVEHAGSLEQLIAETVETRDVARVLKDRTWFDWRYSAPSHEQYEWVRLRGDDPDAAALVGERDASWGAYERGVLRIHEAYGRSTEALTELFIAIVARARAEQKTALHVLAKDEGVETALRAAGFRAGKRYPLIVRKLVAHRLAANVHHFPAWRIVGGDMDSF